MSSETLLRAYRLAVRREALAWEFVPRTVTGPYVPQHILEQWAVCAARQERYARLGARLEKRLRERLGTTKA